MDQLNPHQLLPLAFEFYGLNLKKREGRKYHLDHDYVIEVEARRLFRLSYKGSVVAPFDDVEALCEFIQQDMQLNAHG